MRLLFFIVFCLAITMSSCTILNRTHNRTYLSLQGDAKPGIDAPFHIQIDENGNYQLKLKNGKVYEGSLSEKDTKSLTSIIDHKNLDDWKDNYASFDQSMAPQSIEITKGKKTKKIILGQRLPDDLKQIVLLLERQIRSDINH